jgi:hypothetical protein
MPLWTYNLLDLRRGQQLSKCATSPLMKINSNDYGIDLFGMISWDSDSFKGPFA